jgi:hypothetical protein
VARLATSSSTRLTDLVRDEWENKKAEIEKELSDVLGPPWTVEVNPNQIFAYAGDGYAKESLGSCIAAYVSHYIGPDETSY